MSIRTFLSASVSIFCASLLFRCDSNVPVQDNSKNISTVNEMAGDKVLIETIEVEPSI